MVKKEYYKSAYVMKDKHWEEQFKLQHSEARRQEKIQISQYILKIHKL